MKSFLGYLPDFDVPDEAPGPKPKALSTQLIRRELCARRGDYLTAADLAARTGLTADQVRSALNVWKRRDRIVRRQPCRSCYAWRDE